MMKERQYLRTQARIARLVFLLGDMPEYLHPSIQKMIDAEEARAQGIEREMWEQNQDGVKKCQIAL